MKRDGQTDGQTDGWGGGGGFNIFRPRPLAHYEIINCYFLYQALLHLFHCSCCYTSIVLVAIVCSFIKYELLHVLMHLHKHDC